MSSEQNKARAEDCWERFHIAKLFQPDEATRASETIEYFTLQFDIVKREALEEAAKICEVYCEEERSQIGEPSLKNIPHREHMNAAMTCASRIRQTKEQNNERETK